jgi:hypothetical protein
LDEAWEILSEFGGKDVVNKFRKNLQGDLLKELNRDEKFKKWRKDIRSFMLEVFEKPELLTSGDKVDGLIREGRKLTEKYRDAINQVYNEGRDMLMKIRDDPVLNNFQDKLRKLGRDLACNSQGQTDLYVVENSMTQIKNLLVEVFKDFLVDIPIKRIEVQNDSIDLRISEIFMKGTGLVPEALHVKTSSYSTINFTEGAPDSGTSFRLNLRIDHMKPEFHNVRFDYDKKSFPSMKDQGVTDVIFGGDGLSAEAGITFTVYGGRLTRAEVSTAIVKIDRITFNIDKQQTQHHIIDSLFAPIVAGVMTTKLQKTLEEFLDSRLQEVCQQLNTWFESKPFESMQNRGNEAFQSVRQAVGSGYGNNYSSQTRNYSQDSNDYRNDSSRNYSQDRNDSSRNYSQDRNDSSRNYSQDTKDYGNNSTSRNVSQEARDLNNNQSDFNRSSNPDTKDYTGVGSTNFSNQITSSPPVYDQPGPPGQEKHKTQGSGQGASGSQGSFGQGSFGQGQSGPGSFGQGSSGQGMSGQSGQSGQGSSGSQGQHKTQGSSGQSGQGLSGQAFEGQVSGQGQSQDKHKIPEAGKGMSGQGMTQDKKKANQEDKM